MYWAMCLSEWMSIVSKSLSSRKHRVIWKIKKIDAWGVCTPLSTSVGLLILLNLSWHLKPATVYFCASPVEKLESGERGFWVTVESSLCCARGANGVPLISYVIPPCFS